MASNSEKRELEQGGTSSEPVTTVVMLDAGVDELFKYDDEADVGKEFALRFVVQLNMPA